MIEKAKKSYLVLSAAILLLGLILLVYPGLSLEILCRVTGIWLVIIGIVKVVGYFSNDLYHLAFQFDFAFGIFSAALGMLLLIRPDHIISILPTIMGIFVLADGVLRIQTAKDARLFGLPRWWMILVMGIATVLFGLLLMIKPFESTLAMTMLLGASFLVDGIQNLLVVLSTVKGTRS